MNATLRLHALIPFSRANGPGARAVIWTQGCTLNCSGCFNPETHSFNGGELVAVDDLFQRIAALKNTIEGVTISGGEPLQQLRPLVALLRRVREETELSVIVFTGYTWDEVRRMPEADALLAYVDALIAGRYDQTQRLARDLRGSANKTVHFLSLPEYRIREKWRSYEILSVPRFGFALPCARFSGGVARGRYNR